MRSISMFGIRLLLSITLVNARTQEAYQHQEDGCAEGMSCKEAGEDSFSILQKYTVVEELSEEELRDFTPSSMPLAPTTPAPAKGVRRRRGVVEKRMGRRGLGPAVEEQLFAEGLRDFTPSSVPLAPTTPAPAKGVRRRRGVVETRKGRRGSRYSLNSVEEHSAHHLSRADGTDRSTTAMPWTVDVANMYDLATSLGAPQSDKFTSHSYETMYGTFLSPLAKAKYKPKLLEIGLGCDMDYAPGASVKVWRKLLPHAEIWESDFNKACVERSRSKGLLKGINTLVGDQGDKLVLQQWIKESGGNFDVVIDDGGHRNTQIKASFDALWPTVKPGGLYFLEDLQVGRHEGWDDTGGKMVMSDIIQAWTEQLLIAKNPDPRIAKTGNAAALKWPLPDAVDFILCQREACVVGKSATQASVRDATVEQESTVAKPIDMCQVRPNGRPTLCQTESPWEKAQLKEALQEFGKVYAKRPWQMNGGGQGINHNFALWYTIRALKPTHIIESGVWAGMSTWLMRQAAGPHTWIFSFDPDDSHIQYQDASGKTKYFLGKNWTDLKFVQWDALIPKHNRAKTLVMLDDHQNIIGRVADLLSNGFEHLWYDDNAKHNDHCYNFAWLCDPLPKNTTEILVESLGQASTTASMAEHMANLSYLQYRLHTYFEFPAIYDGCSPSSAALLSDPDKLAWYGLPALEDETYRYWHGNPPYVRLDSRKDAALLESTPAVTGDHDQETPLLAQLPPSTKNMFLQTLNASLSSHAATPFWATYLKQEPKPKMLNGLVMAHTYWHGPFSAKPALAVKSFLVTQDKQQTKVVVWLDKATPDISQELNNLGSHGVEVRLFDFATEVVGTPLENATLDFQSHYAGHEEWPAQRTAADLARYVILHKHGGLWFDADVMFLRPMTPLLQFEFAYPWSKRGPLGLPENHTLNAALLRLFPGSAANEDMIGRAATEKIPFGLWGLSSLKDDTRHPDLSVVDVKTFDALWKDEAFFASAEVDQLIRDEPYPESTRFDWFFLSNENVRDAGLSVLSSSDALAYHWHNRWHMDVQPGSAFSLYESFFDCVLSAMCTKTLKSLGGLRSAAPSSDSVM